MSLRRQMLLAIANNYKWLPYSFEYLYHSLIPATINNKQVKDKTRLFKIEGNSEVVNQLMRATYYTSRTLHTLNDDGSLTFNGTTSGGNTRVFENFDFINNHKYLVILDGLPSNVYPYGNLGSAFSLTAKIGIITASSSGSSGVLGITTSSETTFNNDKAHLSLIDLTQAYPFDTPTSLTDKRVQNIINRGYEGFNSGEIKNTSLGGFISEGFNIWDEQWEVGQINTTTGANNDINYSIRSKNYINVLPNTTYYLYVSLNANIFYYDKDYNYLGYVGLNITNTHLFTTPSNACYMRFYVSSAYGTTYNHDICINLSSSLNGTYKPHLNRLPTEYQEVEYIESTGTQLIETGFKANNNTRIVIDYEPNISYNGVVFWGSDGGQSGRFNFYYYANSSYYRLGYGHEINTDALALSGTRTLCDWNKNVITINNQSYSFSSETFNISGNQIELFYGSGWAQIGSQGSMKLYSCKIYDNGTLIRHFIPCFRKSDNEIGLFDLVNQVFYTNQGTGTFLKGANVNSVSDLSFAYQGSGVGTSHDSVEKTATEWVFTKNMLNQVLGQLAFESYQVSSYQVFRATFTNYLKPTATSEIVPNVMVDEAYTNRPSEDYASYDKSIAFGYSTNYVYIRDDSCADANALITKLSNKHLCMPLATPQVIRIPLKRLAVVDLGTLTWVYRSADGVFSLPTNTLPNLKTDGKVFCSIYTYHLTSVSNLLNMEVSTGASYNAHDLVIRNNSYTNATDFKNAMSGIYLFYETADEVADIDLTMGSEAGGTLNSYDFKWIKNQYVLNGTFDTGSYWSFTNGTKSVADNIMTIATSQNKVEIYQAVQKKVADTWYFYSYYFKVNKSINRAFNTIVQGERDVITNVNANQWYKVVNVIKATGSGNMYFDLFFDNETNNETFEVQLKECELISLAKAKLDDATSINDPRIQRIIKLGYIPTDINGTLTYEETEVLPNVDVKEKAK